MAGAADMGAAAHTRYAVACATAVSMSELESALSLVAAGILPGMPKAVMSSFVTAAEPVTMPWESVVSLRNPLV